MFVFESNKKGQVKCTGITQFKTKKDIKCTLSYDKRGEDDYVLFEDPLIEKVNAGSFLEIEMGFIRNPMSTDVKTGFTLTLLDSSGGKT